MLSKEETVQLSAQYAEKGFLCSEAVLLALSKCLEISSDIIPRIATGLGGGIGRVGEVCGALTGGVLGLGLKFGRTEVSAEPLARPPCWFAAELATQFQAQFGHLRCRDLLGLDVSSKEDRRMYLEQKMWETKCRKFITVATGLAYTLLLKE
ncbi:MAG: C-GCAxxG-C-C family (seleno)protein [Promethearchaeota archaeon]